MKFEKFAIAEEIKENLIQNKYFRTTDIQYKAIPAILNDEDVLAIAQTGSGKTAAYAIPIIHKIHSYKTSKRSYGIKCLVLVPTRELAQQVAKVFAQLSRYTKVTTYAVYGGVDQDPQKDQLDGGVDVLVATPGRMFDLISQKFIDISKVSVLVLDEADQMLDLGFIDDIDSVKRKLKQRHQTLFFSATINPKIKKLAYSQISSKALRIQVSPEKMVSKNIQHAYTKVDMTEKRNLLHHFIQEHEDAKCMIFVRTQVRAERLSEFLKKQDIEFYCIHGGMTQEERDKQLAAFRKKDHGWLIATDVTARGIDLPGMTHVVNFDLPDDPENYVHRIGRTGRGFNKGEALSFCAPEEREKLKAIEEFLQTKLVELKVHDRHFQPVITRKEDMSFADLIAAEEEIDFSLKRGGKKAAKTQAGTKKKK